MKKDEYMNEIDKLKAEFNLEKDKFDDILKPKFRRPFSWNIDSDNLESKDILEELKKRLL